MIVPYLLLTLATLASSSEPRFAGKESNLAAADMILPDGTVLHPGPVVSLTNSEGKKSTTLDTMSYLPKGDDVMPLTLVQGQYGCAPVPPSSFAGITNWGLVVTRGNCTFATKAWHAQVAGASAVLVLNSKSSLVANNGVVVDPCSVYAHRDEQGSVTCDEAMSCASDTGAITFKLSKRDKKEMQCCVDVARSVGNIRSLGKNFFFFSLLCSKLLHPFD